MFTNSFFSLIMQSLFSKQCKSMRNLHLKWVILHHLHIISFLPHRNALWETWWRSGRTSGRREESLSVAGWQAQFNERDTKTNGMFCSPHPPPHLFIFLIICPPFFFSFFLQGEISVTLFPNMTHIWICCGDLNKNGNLSPNGVSLTLCQEVTFFLFKSFF